MSVAVRGFRFLLRTYTWRGSKKDNLIAKGDGEKPEDNPAISGGRITHRLNLEKKVRAAGHVETAGSFQVVGSSPGLSTVLPASAVTDQGVFATNTALEA